MNPEPDPDRPDLQETTTPPARRLFMREPGWKVALKVGSERNFCYMMTPGQGYYHRLLDGEIYVFNGEERICLACAVRRGLLSFEAHALGGGVVTFLDIDAPASVPPFELTPPSDNSDV
jgi:hypothetical protein